ncbi:MAG: S41 family peptidase [Hyphomicrobiaceae bacterium]
MSRLVQPIGLACAQAFRRIVVTIACLTSCACFEQAAAGDRAEQRKFERLEFMVRSMRITRRWHVNKPTRKELIAGAIDGMLRKIDSEAEYYSPSQLKLLSPLTQADELGIELRREPAPPRRDSPGYRVISSRDGTAAAIAGLKAGDLIARVGDQDAGNLSYLKLLDLVGRIGGSAAERALAVVRKDAEVPDTVPLPAIEGRPASADLSEPEPGIIWVRVASVDRAAASVISTELAGARRQLGLNLRGGVLDLRATATGEADGAAEIADLFLDRGIVLNVQQRQNSGAVRRQARPGDLLAGKPLAILIDAGTAGPAEALAAAIAGNRRARVIGLRSAGRGAVRTLERLDRQGRKGAIRLTTGRFLTPKGEAIEGQGVAPDVVEAQAPKDDTCRSLDIRISVGTGGCARRTLAQDGQLRAAIAQLTATAAVKPAVAGSTPAKRAPANGPPISPQARP